MCLWPSNPISVFAFYTQFPNVPCVSNRILTYYFNKNHFRKHFLLISFFILAWETQHKMLWKAEKFKDQVDVIAAFSFFCRRLRQFIHQLRVKLISDIYRCDLAESSIARWHRAGRWHSTCAGGQEILMGRGRGRTSMKQWDAEKQRCWRTQTAVSSRETSLSSVKTQRWPARRQNSGMTMGVQACMLLEYFFPWSSCIIYVSKFSILHSWL